MDCEDAGWTTVISISLIFTMIWCTSAVSSLVEAVVFTAIIFGFCLFFGVALWFIIWVWIRIETLFACINRRGGVRRCWWSLLRQPDVRQHGVGYDPVIQTQNLLDDSRWCYSYQPDFPEAGGEPKYLTCIWVRRPQDRVMVRLITGGNRTNE